MKKDIEFRPVEGVKITIARSFNEVNEPEWDVYLINRLKTPINTVFITSRGYGIDKDGNQVKTSQLRHFHKDIAAEEIIKIEMISPDVFHLNNEYWVSYFVDSQVFDKKFIFVPESITEENLIHIEQLNLQGVLHE
ncbi:hypothetical protein LV89_03296 [Arcicella aurantiaca]|uniref:Uncharacterized protein n=1 Tax=Arcicella aurantiaca TaxID=591202 RepID=A0A316E026_9BACT|nr:hypothetical protein [Arcicella aurantiaca]PWK23028.1 hypothetical protein LV89_03296 [Arcicella aurantiaca]